MMTPEDEIEIEDVEDALKRADELAELTGRRKTDIVADLLDDGKLNRSAGSDIDVKKDMLDIAQEKAEKFKHLITTLLPVLALLMGVGAEGLGVLDITGWGEESVWGDDDPLGPPPIRWGCMDVNADNFDETAQQDDGSCSYEPPDCDSNWQWENVVIRSADLNGEGFNNDLEIELDFRDIYVNDAEIVKSEDAFTVKPADMLLEVSANNGFTPKLLTTGLTLLKVP